MRYVAEHQPGEVGAGDEDVDHRSITSMEAIFQVPVLISEKHAVEACGYRKQEDQRRAVDQRGEELHEGLGAPA